MKGEAPSMEVVLFQSFFFEILTPQNSWEDGSNLTLMNIFQFGVAINYRPTSYCFDDLEEGLMRLIDLFVLV